MQGESGAGRCGMGSRPMCGPGVFFLPEIDVDTLSHARLKTYCCCVHLKIKTIVFPLMPSDYHVLPIHLFVFTAFMRKNV